MEDGKNTRNLEMHRRKEGCKDKGREESKEPRKMGREQEDRKGGCG